MGIPYRLVVSAKTVEGGKHELKSRTHQQVKLLTASELLKAVS
jgi:hypothetical protein